MTLRYAAVYLMLFFVGMIFDGRAVWSAEAVVAKATPMRIVPAPKTVTIAGDLPGWNLTGKLGPVSFDEEAFDDYHATFYAMYDQDNLYLAAVVVEPHLPFNTYPNSGRSDWSGDEVSIRMSTRPGDPAAEPRNIGWDSSPELWNGKFWWNHKEKRTRWQGYRGMNMDGNIYPQTQLPGFAAAVKFATDGHGYTMAMQLPWKFLNADAPRPKPGNAIALLFEVAIGTDNQVEPTRMFQIFGNDVGAGANAFRDYHVWGTAIFQ